jgi:hypothetical protein
MWCDAHELVRLRDGRCRLCDLASGVLDETRSAREAERAAAFDEWRGREAEANACPGPAYEEEPVSRAEIDPNDNLRRTRYDSALRRAGSRIRSGDLHVHVFTVVAGRGKWHPAPGPWRIERATPFGIYFEPPEEMITFETA